MYDPVFISDNLLDNISSILNIDLLFSNFSVDSILRSRAVLISGRLLSSADAYMTINESSKDYPLNSK